MGSIRWVDKRKTSLGQEIDGFTTVNLAGEYAFPGSGLKVKTYVTNLFNATYEEQYKMPAQDRAFGINLNYTF